MHLTKTGKTSRVLLALFVLLSLSPLAPAQQSVATPSDGTPASDAEKRRQSFELVWQTVNQKFYDPNFNGVNWQALHERYAPLVARAANDQELYNLLQQMVNELHQSHFWIIPPQAIPKLPPEIDQTGENDEDELDELDDAAGTSGEGAGRSRLVDRVRRKLTERLSTGIGIDLRVVNGAVLITRVEPGSAAARAGLRSGFVIKTVNGTSLAKVVTDLEQHPIFHEIIRPEIPMILVAAYFNGDLKDTVRLTYLDGRNIRRSVTIAREKLKGEMYPAIGNFPPNFAEFEARRLPSGLGYIRFNAFVPLLMNKVCAALREMHDAPGIVIDLRGNEGGLLGMVGGLAGLLERQPVLLGQMKTRSGLSPVLGYPQRQPYTGKLAILVDGSTLSAAEMFAAGLQEGQRAVVVGDISPGNTLPSGILKLPTGALFQYAFGNYQTMSGVFLEGRGVIPDRIVKLSRRTLLRDGDPQLSAAVKELRTRLAPVRDVLIAEVTAADLPPVRNQSNGVPDGDPNLAPPPPPKPPPPKPPVRNLPPVTDEKATSGDPTAPTAAQIVERYIEAAGGETALRKIQSRVSSGTIELTAAELTGTIDFFEQMPNRSSIFMNLKGLGTIQRTSNGSLRWLQDPLQGYIELPKMAEGEEDLQGELAFRKQVKYLRVEGREKVGGRECFLVVRAIGATVTDRYYFDVENGLLLRKNDVYLEDYRDVEGVKVSFVSRQEFPFGGAVVVRMNVVRHNVPIDESRFAERRDCFTSPAEWQLKK